MEWKKSNIPTGGKLFKVHHFNFHTKGATYLLEIEENSDGSFTGHGEHSADKNFVVGTVTSKTLNDCLEQLMAKAGQRP